MTYRRRSQRDRNHVPIARAAEAAGASVIDTHVVGGFVDMVVGYRGETMLWEVKNPDIGKAGKNSATMKRQAELRAKWRGGRICVVRSVDEALRILEEMQ